MDYLLKFILLLFIVKWIYTLLRLIFDRNYWLIHSLNGNKFNYGIIDILGIISLILLHKR